MRDINNTITLAYVEEDNRQRVIFRVIPLCTREGGTFHGGAEEFPDEGSLRIVPDKREQSTFKERMREIGGLCVIQLAAEGKELMKVRQNRNYAPDQGEKNQMAIYSDVICEFTEDGCFEVIEDGAEAQQAITRKVLFIRNKMLYGPVEKEEAANVSADSLKPFGNDRFLLHTIDAPQVGKHQICWDPEATLNWRQRRNALRKREKPQEESIEARAIENKRILDEKRKEREKQEAERVQKTEQPVQPQPEEDEKAKALRAEKAEKAAARKAEKEKARAAKAEEKKAEKPAVKPAEKSAEKPAEKPAEKEKEKEEALPIGTHLEILDSALPFEQQISRLTQPLSETANRLSSDLSAVEEEEEPVEVTSHFNGTPLAKNSGKPIRSKTKPENVHHVVEQQILGQRDEVMGAELGSGIYGMVLNPIENLRECVEYVWQNADMRQQALQMLMENEAFVADVTDALRRGGMNLMASAAAQEQLAEIEAERISLLMQLDRAKENARKYREEAIAAAAQKKRDEVERLKNEVKQLESTRKKLAEAAKTLSSENAEKVTRFMAEQMTSHSGVADERVLLTPVLGSEYTHQELSEQLRIHMNESGFSISEDEAMSMLISFALYDTLCFRSRTVRDAQIFAKVFLESFGLQSVSADVHTGAHVELMSLLGENDHRTPTVSVQPYGTEVMTVFGHKTIYVADEHSMDAQAEELLLFPVIQTPVQLKRVFGHAAEWKPVAPAALSTFANLRAHSHPLLDEADKWFGDLKRFLQQENVVVPDVMFTAMRRFIELASRKVRGGFLTAADMAVSHWIVPALQHREYDRERMIGMLAGLPRTLELLGVR